MQLTRSLRRAAEVMRDEGVSGLLTRWKSRRASQHNEFDRTHGCDTGGIVSAAESDIEDADGCNRYQAVDPEFFAEAMAHLPIDPREYTFVDLGCGKGRALILAVEAGFRYVDGVELSPYLCSIARRNVGTSFPGLIFNISAADAGFYKRPTVVFLYNPFGPEVLRKVLRNFPSGAYVVYVNPLHAYEFGADFSRLYQSENVIVFRRNP